MSLNNLKKMIIFSDSRTKLMIENMVTDEAMLQKCSASATIEKHLLNNLLPKNINASTWVQHLYDGSWTVCDILKDVFSWNAAGNCGAYSSRYDNLRPLVEFALRQASECQTVITGKEKEFHHFFLHLNSICNKFDHLAEETTDNSRKYLYISEAKWVRLLTEETISNPQNIRTCDYYRLILNNWIDLKDFSVSFKMLFTLVSMEKDWQNNENIRYELTQILKSISTDWND